MIAAYVDMKQFRLHRQGMGHKANVSGHACNIQLPIASCTHGFREVRVLPYVQNVLSLGTFGRGMWLPVGSFREGDFVFLFLCCQTSLLCFHFHKDVTWLYLQSQRQRTKMIVNGQLNGVQEDR